MMSTTRKTFSQMKGFETFDERLNYLKTHQKEFEKTFGVDRWINQGFYQSSEWKRIRNYVIDRDRGLDLGLLPIVGPIYVHHINPLTLEDIENGNEALFDLDNLVCCSFDTHQLIHGFNHDKNIAKTFAVRERYDMFPWKKVKQPESS